MKVADPMVMHCFEQLEPVLLEIERVVSAAPLDTSKIAGLAMLVAARWLGFASASMAEVDPGMAGMSRAEQCRHVAEMLGDVMQEGGHG